jgi:hypothetical protein
MDNLSKAREFVILDFRFLILDFLGLLMALSSSRSRMNAVTIRLFCIARKPLEPFESKIRKLKSKILAA